MRRSDELLTLRAVRGDRRAFDAIYRRYSQQLYRFCLAMTGNPQDAQDALQNTMVKVLRALPGERREIRLKPWLYRIARNESIEARRRRRPGAELDSETAGSAGVAETVETRERLRFLLADLAALPERQRATLVMRELAGLEFAEIALSFGTSQGAVRQTLYEARLRLRELESGRDPGWNEQIKRRRGDLVALAPLPAMGAVGGAGTAGKAVASSALLKLVATVAASVAIVTVTDRAGLVDIPLKPRRDAVSAVDHARHRDAPVSSSAISRDAARASRAKFARMSPARPSPDVSTVGRPLETAAAPAGPASIDSEEAPDRDGEEAGNDRKPVDAALAEGSEGDPAADAGVAADAQKPPQAEPVPESDRDAPPRGREAHGEPPGKREVPPDGPPGSTAKPETPPGKPEATPEKPEEPQASAGTPPGKPESPPGQS